MQQPGMPPFFGTPVGVAQNAATPAPAPEGQQQQQQQVDASGTASAAAAGDHEAAAGMS